MTPDEASDLAERTLAAIDAMNIAVPRSWKQNHRKRVASDLAGLRDHRPTGDSSECFCGFRLPCDDQDRYADGLRRTAALYGVTP